MPAVVRGGRRAVPKTGQTPRPRGGGPRPAAGARRRTEAGKLHALAALGLPVAPLAMAAAGLAILVGLTVLFTGGRAQALAAAALHGLDLRLARGGVALARVHIEGATPEATPAIRRAIGLRRGAPLAGLDLIALKRRIEAVGWVRQARVVRLFPDTLVIEVAERDRLAVWQHSGVLTLIDATGRPIPEANARSFARMPLVVGEGAAQAAPAVIVQARARPRLYARLEAFVRVDGRRWDLRLKDGSLVQLPAYGQDKALAQLDRLDARARLLDLGFERIDLRDPSAPAVRLRARAVSDGEMTRLDRPTSPAGPG